MFVCLIKSVLSLSLYLHIVHGSMLSDNQPACFVHSCTLIITPSSTSQLTPQLMCIFQQAADLELIAAMEYYKLKNTDSLDIYLFCSDLFTTAFDWVHKKVRYLAADIVCNCVILDPGSMLSLPS